ncbi:NAD(P)/FAD-dependent oxidoreductase [Xinfangfangia pollutisoli]|uniref:NAD(P)/FAD-dependent oxidoreductase n=1 Tax=Xinfangfangia pollutisoli TaxID=2865960 RepID=UPI001CD34150|nr:FAD-binding oxidoreductase [Xinfangfangia pollutisoli]
MTVLAPDHREEPYWWMAAPPMPEAEAAPVPPVATADVAIIGGGITGMVAAIHLARGGADVIVADAGLIGGGAARMNAGFLGRTLKRSVAWLEKNVGADQAIGVYRELDEALQGVATFVEAEGIACHRQTCGRLISANSLPHLRYLLKDLEHMKRRLGLDYEVVSKADMSSELASDRYVGGAVIPDLGSIHPGLYHAGLVARAKAAGVRLFPMTAVTGIEPDIRGKILHSARGRISARQVIVATNGYTPRGLKWFARRLVPFHGYVMATEILPSALIDKVLPKRRTYLDTKMSIDFIRPAPDSERILFGGMTGRLNGTCAEIAPALHRRMVEIMPDLAGVRISRTWTGYCAGTFDFMPHIGAHDGVHYALGYNFAGVPIGTLFGRKLAARILGSGDGNSAFDVENFPTLPFFNGTGLVAPLAMKYFDLQDRRMARGK